jgi:hypothetical protein
MIMKDAVSNPHRHRGCRPQPLKIAPRVPVAPELTSGRVDERMLRLYRAWYDLAETAVCVARFRSPHGGHQNDRQSWDNIACVSSKSGTMCRCHVLK